MRKNSAVLILGLIISLTSVNAVHADLSFSIYPNDTVLGPAMDFADVADTESKIKKYPDDFVNKNEDIIGYGMALSNTLGYPNGKAIIGLFPHFEAGFALGAGVYKLDRYKDFEKENPETPGAGVNAALHFGTGITDKIDVTAKMLFYNSFYVPGKSYSHETEIHDLDIKIRKTDIVSMGFKGRYNIFPKKDLVPYIFSFSGLTAGVSVDFVHGAVSTNCTYKDTRDVDLEGSDLYSGDSFTQEVNITTDVSGSATTEWNIVSLTPEIMVYCDLFTFLSLYTGPALSLCAGNTLFYANANGAVVNNTPVYADQANSFVLAIPGSTIATGVLYGDSYFNVPWVIPMWKLGLEINIVDFKIQLEAASVLTSPLDSFTAQLGFRVQM